MSRALVRVPTNPHTINAEDAMAGESLQDVYIEQLKDLYSAEHQILKALPKLAEASTHSELQKAFQESH